MPIVLDGTSGITTPMYNGAVASNQVTPSVNMKNRIINGNMVIDQRNAGGSVANAGTSTQYSLDRWNTASNGSVNNSSISGFSPNNNSGGTFSTTNLAIIYSYSASAEL